MANPVALNDRQLGVRGEDTMVMLDEKPDIKNIELLKQIGTLRDHLDVHRIVGLNAVKIKRSGVSNAFAGYLQHSAQDALAIQFCKIFERSGRHDLNSIPGIIDSLPDIEPSSAQRRILEEFGVCHSNASEPMEVKEFLTETFRLFSKAHDSVLGRLRRHRNTIGAHSDNKATRDALPSHAEFETLYEFAHGFHQVVARAVVGVSPATIPRKTGRGLIRLLTTMGVEDAQFDFPAEVQS